MYEYLDEDGKNMVRERLGWDDDEEELPSVFDLYPPEEDGVIVLSIKNE